MADHSIDGERLVRQFLELVQIDSPSFEEAKFMGALAAELGKLGLAAESDGTGRDGAGNLLAVLPGTDPAAAPILLSMHTDTVEPGRGIRPHVADGVVRSDGTTILGGDNKSAVAATLEAVRYLQAARPPHGDVELLFTWGEERGLYGARAFDIAKLRSRIGFVPDGAGPPGTIITRAPYHDIIDAVFTGKAAHAGSEPETGISALVAAARAIARMPLGRIDAETTGNIGRIAGGTVSNAVPERVEMKGEARSLDRCKLDYQVNLMRAATESAAREIGARVEFAVERQYDGYTLGEDEAPVRIVTAACRALGLAPTIMSTGGGADANIFNAQGLRTVVLGIGGQEVHSTREHVSVADLVHLSELIAALVVEAGRQLRGS